MIGRIEGSLRQVRPGQLIVETGGVGYLVAITLRAFHDLSGREHAALWIHTYVREDAIVLYGFLERDDLDAFEQLIAVAGVGPRIALAVLSSFTAAELARAVEDGAAGALQRTPGVGRKTAERIVLELRGRLAAGAAGAGDLRTDAVSALANLGYNDREARAAVDAVAESGSSTDLADVLRLALQRLRR